MNVGALNIKHKVQTRTLRVQHEDSHYCANMFKFMKELGVKATTIIDQHSQDDGENYVKLYSMDDKAR